MFTSFILLILMGAQVNTYVLAIVLHVHTG